MCFRNKLSQFILQKMKKKCLISIGKTCKGLPTINFFCFIKKNKEFNKSTFCMNLDIILIYCLHSHLSQYCKGGFYLTKRLLLEGNKRIKRKSKINSTISQPCILSICLICCLECLQSCCHKNGIYFVKHKPIFISPLHLFLASLMMSSRKYYYYLRLVRDPLETYMPDWKPI